MADTPLSTDAVQRIVAEVLRRIRAEAALPVAVPSAVRAPGGTPAPAAVQAAAGPVPASGTALPDKVVTLATLERLPRGSGRIVIGPAAVVTPSAREFARDAGIEIVRGRPAAASGAARPCFVAQAESDRDGALKAAAVVRAVPGTQQIAAAGLADVSAALALHLTRDGGRGILLAARPFLATAVANRAPGVRAVTGRDAAGLFAAATECAANLLVVDPRHFSAGSLARLGEEFARRDLGPVPGELAARPEPAPPCHCRGHAHP